MDRSPKRMQAYQPDYLVTPGEILEEYLESMGMTQVQLALRTGLAQKTVNEIIQGKAPITPETALKLERVLGRPAHFWNNLELRYQEYCIRLEEQERLRASVEWVEQFPVRSMVKLGFIPELVKDSVEQLEALLRFFGIASPEHWEQVWSGAQVAFRQTPRFENKATSVCAWLRQGELLAQHISCEPFNKKRFQAILNVVRELTREVRPNVFIRKLEELCSSAGVVVVFVPELPNSGVYGATRWMGDKAVIMLSLRYKSNDHLWFTFFHEAGHILKHGRKEVFLEGIGLSDEKEEEADTFAQDKLIPPAAYRNFLSSWNKKALAPIERFADEVGIAPGIVVGRLQREEKLPYNTGNRLKVFYKWKERDEE